MRSFCFFEKNPVKLIWAKKLSFWGFFFGKKESSVYQKMSCLQDLWRSTSLIVIFFFVLASSSFGGVPDIRDGLSKQKPKCVPSLSSKPCPKGIYDKQSHELKTNPKCPVSPPDPSLRKNATLTFAMLYYGDQTMLCAHLLNWMSWPRHLQTQVQFLIIDDGSPERSEAVEMVNSNHTTTLNIRIVKIQQDICWNIGGARNLAVFLSVTDGIFLTDSDTFVPSGLVTHLLQSVKTEQFYLFFSRDWVKRPHPAIMLFNRQKYWEVGGCDEDFVGHYGQTDPHFRYRMGKAKITFVDVQKNLEWPKLFDGKKFLGSCPKVPSFELNRDTHPNSRLLGEKKSGKIPWSTTFLRFDWQELYLLPGGDTFFNSNHTF